ncbi:WD40 repeat-like protein [Gyrodon lividus]|nr:WD40 repeat-like protein [Gyrodon lividus]
MSQKSIDLSSKPLWTMSGHEDSIWNIAYLGGDQLVTCSFDKTIRVWNVENGNQEGTSMEHDGRVFGLAVTRDKKRILSGDENSSNRVKVWNVESHECIEEWGPTGSINCISMSPDDRLAASGYSNGKIVVREIKEDGEIKHSIQAGSWVTSLCFSPNGEKLASLVGEFEDDRAIYVTRVYDVESGKLILGPIKGHEDVVRCVIWSLDGSQLFSASDDYTVRCWSTETGEPIGQPWTGHTHNVTSLSLSPDGSKLASTSWDHTVRFWDARSGEPIGRPLQHDNWLWAVTFSPSGEFVASGGRDKKVSIWRVPWWDGIQKQAHESFLDLPAVPAPNDLSNDQAQHELDFFNPPATRRLITPTSQPFVHPANPPTSPTVTRVRRFWRGLVARSASSPAQQATELQSMHERRFWKAPAHIPVTEVAAGHMTDKVVVGRRERRRRKKEDKPQTHADNYN